MKIIAIKSIIRLFVAMFMFRSYHFKNTHNDFTVKDKYNRDLVSDRFNLSRSSHILLISIY